MKNVFLYLLLTVTLALCACPLQAQTLAEASRQAARQYNAEVISARTETKNGKKVHVIKLLTKKGVVKTVRIPVRDNKRKG